MVFHDFVVSYDHTGLATDYTMPSATDPGAEVDLATCRFALLDVCQVKDELTQVPENHIIG